MAGDTLHAYYGIRYSFSEEADIEGLENRTDTRIQAAKRHGLAVWWGPLTDGEYYFLLIGTKLCCIGADTEDHVSLDRDATLDTIDKTSTLLQDAGFEETPGFHFQLEAEY